MTEQEICHFWDVHPCGDTQVESARGDYESFFERYDLFRYSHEAHILKRLDEIDFKGKRVLEIGLGQGADSEQIIRRGGLWSGLDLTSESINRVSTRLQLRGLHYESLERGSALSIPFPDNSFDIVFSHGVLHHIPDIVSAQHEIARVLRPNGRLIAMLYARRSLNYLLAISVIRRAALAAVYVTGIPARGIVGGHVSNAKRLGLMKYLRLKNFIHCNTDGPANPYSKVYSLSDVARDFPDFRIETTFQEHMHAPPLPVSWLRPLAGVLGWHLWVNLVPRKVKAAVSAPLASDPDERRSLNLA